MDPVVKTSLMERIVSPIRISVIIIIESLKSFLNNNNFEMSAALATYSFFAIVPLLFFIVNIAGGQGGTAALLVPGVEGLIDHLFPRIRDWMSIEFTAIIKHRFTLGAAIMVFVFIAVMSLMDSLRTAFSKIFRKEPPASFIMTQLRNARSALVMFLLFVLLIIAEIVFFKVTGYFKPDNFILTKICGVAVSLCVATLCMVVFYFVFLPTRPAFIKLIGASAISAVLIIFMREIFAYIIKTNPGYGETFGSLKILFVMIIWVYYCFLVILFGAEVAVNTEKRNALLLKRVFTKQMERSLSANLFKRFTMDYQEGDIIFNEGDTGDNMFYVISGRVDIIRGGKHIRAMRPGEYFGEMSMLIDAPRSAGACAASSDTRLIGISMDNFEIILRENAPIVLSILREMAGRLKDTDESFFKHQLPD